MPNGTRKLPLVVGAVVLIGGAWGAWRLLHEDPASSATLAPSVPLVVTHEPAVLPVAEPATASVESPAAAAAAPSSVASVPPAPAAPPAPSAVWDDVYRVLDGLAKGGLTGEDALRLADELLARLPAAGPPEVSENGNRLTWTLVDDPAFGTLKFTQLKEPGEQQHEFEVAGQVTTRPGAYTGHADDAAVSSRFSLVISADANDQLGHVGVLSRVRPRKELALTTEVGKDMPVGGALSVKADGSTWIPMVVQNATGADGKTAMAFRMLDPVTTTGSLADARGTGLGQRVAGLRGH